MAASTGARTVAQWSPAHEVRRVIYLLCIILPPVAVLLKGKPMTALLNLLLTLLLWVPGIIHAFMVVTAAEADARNKRLEKAIRETGSTS